MAFIEKFRKCVTIFRKSCLYIQGHRKGIEMEDKEIIELYISRDEHAISETSDKYSSLLKRVSLNILGSESDAEECVSDAYLQVWNSIPPNRPDSLSAYLVSVVRNITLNRLKMMKADKRGKGEHALSLDELESHIGFCEDFDDGEVSRIINDFLRSEKQVHRVIFIRRYYLCESYAEISGKVGLGESAVRMGLSRMRKRLKEYLEKEGVFI